MLVMMFFYKISEVMKLIDTIYATIYEISFTHKHKPPVTKKISNTFFQIHGNILNHLVNMIRALFDHVCV